MAEKFRRARFDIKIEFHESGITLQKEVVAISGAYALNSIPVASATIAAGREVKTGTPSQIHSSINSFKLREPVTISLKITTDGPYSGVNGMISNWCVIFEGYYAGIGYQRTYESANFTLNFIHWLDDLACSSALNGSWHPGVPHDLAQAAEGDVAIAGGGSNISNITSIVDPGRTIITPPNIRADLWGAVLKKILQELATREIGKQFPGAGDAADANKANNAAALKALERMPGESPRASKLPLNMPEDGLIGLAAVQAINGIIKTGLAYSSFWSKLVGEFGAEFLFGISPGATFANVIPYFGAINREWVTITGKDYAHASFHNSLVSLINSVEIRFAQNPTSAIWGIGGQAPSISYYRPLAKFPDSPPGRGQVIIKDPPAWIANTVPAAVYGPLATGVQKKPSDHGQGEGNPPAGARRPAEEEKKLQASAIVQAYAEHLYKTEVLAQRRGELSGKLRFDIAPGSIVKIEAPDSDIQPNFVALPLDFYAMVTQVSFAINAEMHTAGTSFAFTNLRTSGENSDSNLTSTTSPTYANERWNGGPLVKEAMP